MGGYSWDRPRSLIGGQLGQDAATCGPFHSVGVLHGVSKRCHSVSKNAKIVLKKSFKEHLSSDFLCKNFIDFGQISQPQHQFEVKGAFQGEALLTQFWFLKFFFEVFSFLNGFSHRYQIGLKLKFIKFETNLASVAQAV